jgi:hypothetical protein
MTEVFVLLTLPFNEDGKLTDTVNCRVFATVELAKSASQQNVNEYANEPFSLQWDDSQPSRHVANYLDHEKVEIQRVQIETKAEGGGK